ncbi:MAG: winged helix-turn-helix transcriptional regulator [Erysipelotrichaceae bacterium]|nr:winged helix-turn-helix transcriptional regulator [Erysipelotrichaceae bacterium]
MTNKEKEILEIITNNPTIEQSEIARLLHISRSTVAVHISSLQKQGFLLGKGYIVNHDTYITGIGACNVDVYGKSLIPIKTHYDHPAHISSNVGGVMYNIICNFTKLGGKARLITAYGDDSYGNTIVNQCLANDIDITESLPVKNATSGIFMQIQDDDNDMYLAICDMSILEHITPAYLRSKERIITNSEVVVMDPSLPIPVIEELITICENKVPIYVDPISDNYAQKIKPYTRFFSLIKPNKTELESLTDIRIENDDDLDRACEKLLDTGTKKVVVSRGSKGLLYRDRDHRISRVLPPEENIVNASGAGDALMAAIIYAEVQKMDLYDGIDLGLAAGIAAIRSETTINEQMSIDLLDRILKEKRK